MVESALYDYARQLNVYEQKIPILGQGDGSQESNLAVAVIENGPSCSRGSDDNCCNHQLATLITIELCIDHLVYRKLKKKATYK